MRSLSSVFGAVVIVSSLPSVVGAQTADHRDFESPDAVDAPPWWSRLYLRPSALHMINGFRVPARGLEPVAAFLSGHEISDAAYPVHEGAWTRGIENLSIAHGSNEFHARTEGSGGYKSGEATLTAAGSLVEDHVWYFAGAAPRMDGEWSALPWAASLNTAFGPEIQSTTWIVGAATEGITRRLYGELQERPAAFTQQAAVAGHGWNIKWNNNRSVLDLAIGAHRDQLDVQRDGMTESVSEQRVAARARLTRRLRSCVGSHRLELGLESATSSADDGLRMRRLDTTEVTAYAGDSWQLLPNFTLDAGMRWDQQLADQGIAAEVHDELQPRAGAVYDWTREGRSKIYVHWGRYFRPATLDETAADSIDESIAGTEYEIMDDLSMGAAAVGRSDGNHSVRLNATARFDWLRGNLLYDSHLGLDLRAGALLSFLSPHLVGSVKLHTAARVPSSLRLEYYMLLFDQDVRAFADVLVDEQAPDVRVGMRADF